jgi:hypothetical protein
MHMLTDAGATWPRVPPLHLSVSRAPPYAGLTVLTEKCVQPATATETPKPWTPRFVSPVLRTAVLRIVCLSCCFLYRCMGLMSAPRSFRLALRRVTKSAARTCLCANNACSGRSPSSRAGSPYASLGARSTRLTRVWFVRRACDSSWQTCTGSRPPAVPLCV